MTTSAKNFVRSAAVAVAFIILTTSPGVASWFGSRDETSTAVEDVVSGPDFDGGEARDPVKLATRAFYKSRDFELAWSGNNDAVEAASAVRLTLEHAERQGLHSADYTAELARWGDAPDGGHDAIEYDVALTEALIRYALDVRNGRTNPHDVYKDVGLPLKDFDVADALETAVRRGTIVVFLADLPPPHPGYRWLVEALARYRTIAERGGWPKVAAVKVAVNGKDGKPTALARRLALEDPALAGAANPGDGDVADSLKRFQKRNDLAETGTLSAETLRALNVSVQARIGTIVANLERWRWVPRAFEPRYILVDVPDQSLDLIASQGSLLHSRVVVGRTRSPTPIMKTYVLGIVANPPWDIPPDIAAKQILPRTRHNPRYLASRNMVMRDGGLEQNAGPDNVLGKVMLDSPNDFGVYMHDTPNKKLFQSDMRQMSNGCVRVEEVMKLAALVLGSNGGDLGTDEFNLAIASGETQHLPLANQLAVYMLYWTATAGPDGTVAFRPDIYNRDPRLITRLNEAPRGEPAVPEVSLTSAGGP